MDRYILSFDVVFAVKLAIYALATYRFTMLIYEEAGPWYIFDWIRAKAGVQVEQSVENDKITEIRVGEGFWAELFNCPYCLSGWISLFMLVGFVWGWFDLLALWGAIWAIVYLLIGVRNES